MHLLKRLAVLLGASTLLLAGTATAAQATTRSCAVNGARVWLNDSCRTDSVGAYSDHSVWIAVAPYSGCKMDYKVRDIANNKVVLSGRTSNLSRWVFGLHSFYRLEVTKVGRGCGGDAVIKGV
ncbi:hypothetical protein [Actinoplanes sp. NPDC049316]|uniref:hypothetical protein n=1 Tax=Actinoplanes sp. NPDC049316 TaxID=3154727 RepID=UPI003447F695